MSAHLLISAEREGMPQLRRHIISTYRRAEEIIGRAGSAPPSKMHALMQEYDKLCDRMQADIAQAGNFYPNHECFGCLAVGRFVRRNHARERSASTQPRRPSHDGRSRERAARSLNRKIRLRHIYAGVTPMKATDRERPIRRRIIRQWMTLPRDKRQTVEQIKEFTERAVSQHQFARSRRDPRQKIAGWLLPRLGRRRWNEPRNG